MKDASIEQADGIDPDLFSPEELEMMGAAQGVVDGPQAEHDAAELQRQYSALARMVAEGGERERQLRALVHELTALAKANDQQRAYHQQTENLARLVVASSERELHLQQCLEAIRTMALNRVRSII